jgi:hypothetical protein
MGENNKFTDEQMVTLLTWLEDKKEAGYDLDDVIAELAGSSIKDFSK